MATRPTVALRPAHESDLADLCALQNRSDTHDGVQRVWTVEELTEELGAESVGSLHDGVRVAFAGGVLAGYAYTYYLPSEVREERCFVFGVVDPVWRRRGVGTALMRWAFPRAEALLRSAGRDLPRYVRTDNYEQIESAAALYASLGMVAVRWTDELLRPLTALPPLPPSEAIPGVRIVPWPDGRDEEIRAEKNAADNPTGAARLYRSLGFEPNQRSVVWQVEVTDR